MEIPKPSAKATNVVVEDGLIREISGRPADTDADTVDCAGRVLMPGLIDAHVHVYAAGLNVQRVAQSPASYLAHFAARFMRACLDRGFTTLRDVGGADVGLASAIKDGLLDRVPRLFYGGRVISQTGGHGDFRPGDHGLDTGHYCGCSWHGDQFAAIADGPTEVRKAVREELRRGASPISRSWPLKSYLLPTRWSAASTRKKKFERLSMRPIAQARTLQLTVIRRKLFGERRNSA